jgi:hypothetical protein
LPREALGPTTFGGEQAKGRREASGHSPGAGTIVLSGKQIKTVKRSVLAAGIVSLTVTPKGKLAHKFKITGKATAKVTFTPTGGSAKTETSP